MTMGLWVSGFNVFRLMGLSSPSSGQPWQQAQLLLGSLEMDAVQADVVASQL